MMARQAPANDWHVVALVRIL